MQKKIQEYTQKWQKYPQLGKRHKDPRIIS